jgi:glycosyltransferase involved in cell wall biosynthesis
MSANIEKISVILPVYNGMPFLKTSVESVLAQQWQNFELLIVDDCSTDNSYKWLQSLQDERIKLFRNSINRGLFYNLNFLIKHCGTSLIKLWSQDDVMYPDCLGAFVSFHQQYPDIGFSYCNRDYIDANGNFTITNIKDDTPAIISTSLHTRIAFYTGSIAGNIANVAITKAAIDSVGLFNEQMKISGDFEMWVRIARYFPVGFINKPVVQLRNHKQQLSSQGQFYIYHVQEDLQVYRYLLSYCTAGQKAAGMHLMLHYKLNFYYTLMLKALLKGDIKMAFRFGRLLSGFTNFFTLSFYYIKNKLFGTKRPVFDLG